MGFSYPTYLFAAVEKFVFRRFPHVWVRTGEFAVSITPSFMLYIGRLLYLIMLTIGNQAGISQQLIFELYLG